MFNGGDARPAAMAAAKWIPQSECASNWVSGASGILNASLQRTDGDSKAAMTFTATSPMPEVLPER